jgi:diaminopimelate epimerase
MSVVDSRPLGVECEELMYRSVNGLALDGLKFSIMHGNGNVILVVDEALTGLSARDVNSDLGREICQWFRSVRVDGISFLRTTGDRVRMTYFERDGTRSQMCGNALRCSTRYCAEQGYIGIDGFIATDDGDKWVSASEGRIQVALGPEREFHQVAEDRYFVFSGLPHLVLLVDDLPLIDVRAVGAALRYDDELCSRLGHPEGIHVDFLQKFATVIGVRTYEVGVEDETLACGTGVAASAFVAHKAWGLPFPVDVRVRGGEMTVDHNSRGLLISGTTEYLFSNVRTSVTSCWPLRAG